MKKLILSFLILFYLQPALAQKVKDSITIVMDTVNIHGKVVDETGKPIIGATVLSETFDQSYRYIKTQTNNKGLFRLNGINPKDMIRIRKKDIAIEQPLKGSRYLFIVMLPLNKLELNTAQTPFYISAKRIAVKEKYTSKRVDTLNHFVFDPFGIYSPANYPGGRQKFYDFIQKNIVYPEKAIQNNVEGTVKIDFTVDGNGLIKDFLIVRDIGYGCAEEVIRVIKSSKKWNSAMNGLTVDQRVSIQIPFQLID